MEQTTHTPTIRQAAAQRFLFATRRSTSIPSTAQSARPGTRAPLTRDEVAQIFGTELYGSRNR